jgi:O-antigen ligase
MFELGGRGPILSLVVVMFLFYFLRFVISLKLNMKFKINFKTIMFFSSILIVLIFYSQEIFTTIFDEINFQRFFSFDTYKDDESVLVRANYLRKGYESILEHPFFGMGIGSSGLILESNDIVIYPHNLFVEAFMELGFMGAFSYLFLYLIFFFSNISLIKTNKNLLLLFLISLIYFMEDNKSNSFDSWRVSIIWIMMFIIEKKKHLLSQNDFDSELI